MTEYTVNKLHLAAWLVYLNGLEIPCSGVTVQFRLWAPPVVQLRLAPHPLLTRIGAEDRIQVAVFYLDHHYNPGSPEFRLLTEAEITGWGYNSTSGSRFLEFTCVSHLRILEEMRFYYLSTVDSIVSGLQARMALDPSTVTAPKPMYPASLFLHGLTSSAENDFIRRPIDFALNLFKGIVGEMTVSAEDPTKVPRELTSVPGKNFYARWMITTKFHRKWVAFPVLEGEDAVNTSTENTRSFPILEAAQNTMVMNAMQQMSLGGASGSAWDLFQQIYGYMQMEVLAIPCPSAVVCNPKTRIIQHVSPAKPSALSNRIERLPEMGPTEDPVRQALETPTEDAVVEGTFNPLAPASSEAVEVAMSIATDVPDSVTEASVAQSTGATKRTLAEFVVKPHSAFAHPPMCNVIFPSMISQYSLNEDYAAQPTRVYLSEQFMNNILSGGGSASLGTIIDAALMTGYPEVVRKRMRDYNNADATVPATSNARNLLIFPEEFFKGPSSADFTAPPWLALLEQALNNAPEVHQLAELEQQRMREENVGVVDRVVRLVSEDAFQERTALTEEQVQASVDIARKTYMDAMGATLRSGDNDGDDSASVIGRLFDLYAQSEFYRARFGTRTGGVSTCFNPYVVPGFPTTVLVPDGSGMDCMAMVQNVTHSFDAQGSMGTNVALSHIRMVPEFTLFGAPNVEVYPPEPIPTTRSVLQDPERKRTITCYRDLFIPGQKIG
jgi:hypothetical protein